VTCHAGWCQSSFSDPHPRPSVCHSLAAHPLGAAHLSTLSIPALRPLATTFCSDPAGFFGLHTLSINPNHLPPSIPVYRVANMRSVQTVGSTQAIGLGFLLVVEPLPALSRVVVPSLCLSPFHLPASLGSTGITPLLRYYEGSVTSRIGRGIGRHPMSTGWRFDERSRLHLHLADGRVSPTGLNRLKATMILIRS
jgi:hypothetical protein